MELIYFAIVAIVLYVFSDFMLRLAESHVGRRFEQRSLIFFAILLTSALIVFALVRQFSPS
jgi:hypothetical protein